MIVTPPFGQTRDINKLAKNEGYQDCRSIENKAVIDTVQIGPSSNQDGMDWE